MADLGKYVEMGKKLANVKDLRSFNDVLSAFPKDRDQEILAGIFQGMIQEYSAAEHKTAMHLAERKITTYVPDWTSFLPDGIKKPEGHTNKRMEVEPMSVYEFGKWVEENDMSNDYTKKIIDNIMENRRAPMDYSY